VAAAATFAGGCGIAAEASAAAAAAAAALTLRNLQVNRSTSLWVNTHNQLNDHHVYHHHVYHKHPPTTTVAATHTRRATYIGAGPEGALVA